MEQYLVTRALREREGKREKRITIWSMDFAWVVFWSVGPDTIAAYRRSLSFSLPDATQGYSRFESLFARLPSPARLFPPRD